MDHISKVTLSPKTRIILYADNILLYTLVNGKSILSSFQSDIDAISCWISSAGLSLNQTKAKLLVFSRKCCPLPILLKAAGPIITQVTLIKYLSVYNYHQYSVILHGASTSITSAPKLNAKLVFSTETSVEPIQQVFYNFINYWSYLSFLDYCSSV